jgi:outer membrane protein OmpA-like peptidoglycan-associated protein
LFEDEDGCPEEDNDNDGFLDADDKCPNLAEDYDGYRDDDGCPEETGDTDGDGILDDVDGCVDQPETQNNYLDKDGCPDTVPRNVRITDNQIIIEEKILFATGKAVILRESYGILHSVAQVMKDYSQITIRVDGHTDDVGSDKYNLKLSQKRSKSVRQHLIKVEEIDASRLESKGFGESTPIADNKTKLGKEKNRRVEFTILNGME